MSSQSRRLALMGLVIASTMVLVHAQTGPGDLFGKVTDVTGAPVPGAGVSLNGPLLAQPKTTVTSSAGVYQFAQLPPGSYVVSFTMQGFFPLTRGSVVIGAGAHVALDVALAVATGPAFTRDPTPSPTPTGLKGSEVAVELETTLGKILIAVDMAHAPITSANFLKYVDGGFYNGGRVHRVTRPDNYTPSLPNRPAMEIIQAGINPAKRPEAFPPIPLERTSVTGLKHVAGTVSMARGTGADTATSDFFILLDDQPSLDFGGKRFDDEQGAAAFGRVVNGLDVVRKIQQQPVDPQTPQNLRPPVPIVKAGRI
jgi:peptidyl-prolyl cis-trans isomerase A (cyclophilin A)